MRGADVLLLGEALAEFAKSSGEQPGVGDILGSERRPTRLVPSSRLAEHDASTLLPPPAAPVTPASFASRAPAKPAALCVEVARVHMPA